MNWTNKKKMFLIWGMTLIILCTTFLWIYYIKQNIENSPPGKPPGWMWFWWSSEVENWTSANTISKNGSYSWTYTSSWDDENALRVDWATVNLDWINIQKTWWSTSNTENWDFYWMNAWLLASSWAKVTINNSSVTTNAQNWNGIFSYWEWTEVTINNSKIITKKNNSWWIQTTWGWKNYANNLEVETSWDSSAAIRSDRGGWIVVVNWWTYVSNGLGSPAVYSTADITVKNATLKANWSEAIVVEWENSVTLENVDLTGNMDSSKKSDNENIHNVMIYQSMSWDADVGKALFKMTWWSLTGLKWDLFYVTNTSCEIDLENVELKPATESLFLISGNSNSRWWWTAGSNWWIAVLKNTNQKLNWTIVVDKISSLDMSLNESSNFTWSINSSNEWWKVNVTIDGTSKWTLSQDSYVTTLSVNNKNNIDTNGHKLYVNGKVWNQ